MSELSRFREWAAGLLERDEPYYSIGLVLKSLVETWRAVMSSIGLTALLVGSAIVLPDGVLFAQPWVPEIASDIGIAGFAVVALLYQVVTIYSELHCEWPGA